MAPPRSSVPFSPFGQTSGSVPTGTNGPFGEVDVETPMHWRSVVASRAV
jgi:hypothetical protein